MAFSLPRDLRTLEHMVDSRCTLCLTNLACIHTYYVRTVYNKLDYFVTD